MPRLDEYVGSLRSREPLPRELPLVHNTRYDSFVKIGKTGELRPKYCRVFDESLVYLFYGRPAFQTRAGGKPARSFDPFPVCFVFKPSTVSKRIRRVFPFDTGAASDGMFEEFIPKSSFRDYELASAIDSARRITRKFFDTNQKYYIGKARKDLLIPAAEADTKAYYDMITFEDSAEYDHRNSAIEIQIETAITLKDTLLMIILPMCFLEDASVCDLVYQELRTLPIFYTSILGSVPSHCVAAIQHILMEQLRKAGYL